MLFLAVIAADLRRGHISGSVQGRGVLQETGRGFDEVGGGCFSKHIEKGTCYKKNADVRCRHREFYMPCRRIRGGNKHG